MPTVGPVKLVRYFFGAAAPPAGGAGVAAPPAGGAVAPPAGGVGFAGGVGGCGGIAAWFLRNVWIWVVVLSIRTTCSFASTLSLSSPTLSLNWLK